MFLLPSLPVHRPSRSVLLRLLLALLVPLLIVALLVVSSAPSHAAIPTTTAQADTTPAELVARFGGEVQDLVIQGSLAYKAEGGTLVVLDISDPARTVRRGTLPLPLSQEIFTILVSGQRVYMIVFDIVLGQMYLHSADVADPDAPELLGSMNIPWLQALWVSGSLAYVASGNPEPGHGSMQVFDLADPHNPRLLSTVALLMDPYGITVVDGMAYLAGQGTAIVDVRDPHNPIVQSRSTMLYMCEFYEIQVVNQLMYLACGLNGLQIFDVRNPRSPSLRARLTTSGRLYDLQVVENLVYLASGDNYSSSLIGSFQIADVTNPASPQILSTTPLSRARQVAVQGQYAYVCDDYGEPYVFDVSDARAPQVLSHASMIALSYHIHVDGTMAYLPDPRHFSAVDVSSPARPVMRGQIQLPFFSSMDLVDQIAYLVYRDGLHLVDVRDPDRLVLRSTLTPLRYITALRVVNGLAYATSSTSNGAGILYIIDVHDPDQPVVLSTYALGRYGLDLELVGTMLYIATDSALYAIDVADPTNPVLRGSKPATGGWFTSLEVVGTLAFLGFNFGQTSPRGTVHVIDVSNPTMLTDRTVITIPNAAMAEGLEIADDKLYVLSNGVALTVLDIRDLDNPGVIGSITIPGGTTRVALANGLLYAASGQYGVSIVRLPDSMSPSPTATTAPTMTPTAPSPTATTTPTLTATTAPTTTPTPTPAPTASPSDKPYRPYHSFLALVSS